MVFFNDPPGSWDGRGGSRGAAWWFFNDPPRSWLWMLVVGKCGTVRDKDGRVREKGRVSRGYGRKGAGEGWG